MIKNKEKRGKERKKIRKKNSEKWSSLLLLLGVVLIFLVVRLWLFSSFHLPADGAVFGLMAKHILEKGEHPFFFYGAHYGGAMSIVSHASAVFFLVGGVSESSYKFTNLTISLIFLIVTYVILNKLFNRKIAILTGLFLAISPPLFTWFNLIGGPYIVSFLLNLILVFLFYQIFFSQKVTTEKRKVAKTRDKATVKTSKKETKRIYVYLILFGLIAGIAWYALEFVIPLILVSLIFWYIFDKKFFLTKRFFVFLTSFVVGMAPLIYYNITHQFANIKQFFAGTIVHRLACNFNLLPKTAEFGGKIVDPCIILTTTQPGQTIPKLLTKTLPSFFGNTNLAWIYYAIFVLALVFLIYTYRKDFKKLLFGLIPYQKYSVNPASLHKETIIIAFSLFFIVCYFFSGFPDPIHLMLLYPFLHFMLALFVLSLYNSIHKKIKVSKTKKVLLIMPLLLIVSLLAIPLIENLNFVGVNDPAHVSGEIAFLDSQDITRVYAEQHIKWLLIFQSNERIIASCDGLPCLYKYPLYEEIVNESDDFAYVFNEPSGLSDKLKTYLDSNNVTYKTKIFDKVAKRILYYDLSEKVRPSEAIKEFSEEDEANPIMSWKILVTHFYRDPYLPS